MVDIFKPKNDEPIRNGSSIVNEGGLNLRRFDNSKDSDPTIDDISADRKSVV